MVKGTCCHIKGCMRRLRAPPLNSGESAFPTRSGRPLSRREAAAIIRRIAAQANAHLPEEENRGLAAYSAAYLPA